MKGAIRTVYPNRANDDRNASRSTMINAPQNGALFTFFINLEIQAIDEGKNDSVSEFRDDNVDSEGHGTKTTLLLGKLIGRSTMGN